MTYRLIAPAVLVLSFVAFVAAGLMECGPVAADDWPQWMGPNRDDVWAETGIVDAFPEGGPKVLWRKPISGGFSGPAVAAGKVYVTDYDKASGDAKPVPTKRNSLVGKERIFCLDAKTGAELWKHEYECDYTIAYPAGPRCTPTVDEGRVYTLGAMGDLLCLDAQTGKVVWSRTCRRPTGHRCRFGATLRIRSSTRTS
jgi:outer membrane protein assembly factor BamB